MNNIGITSTIPIEIIYASGNIPVDINNIFVSSDDSINIVKYAKTQGFPDTTCSWICGLYGAIIKSDIKKVIGVTGGDCSETIALMEVLSCAGIDVIPFSYPAKPDVSMLKNELDSLAARLNTRTAEAMQFKERFDAIRKRIHYLDYLLWHDNKAYGSEVRTFQLSSSDFQGNPESFAVSLEKKISEIENRSPIDSKIRLGITGVPPIVKDLYAFLEKDDARVVFSEVERQFSLPVTGSLELSYSKYTYPYGIFYRLEDIAEQTAVRKIDGIIHYVQSFCFRGIEDIILQKKLKVPVLTLQGDLPHNVTETQALRLEAFIDMLYRRKFR